MLDTSRPEPSEPAAPGASVVRPTRAGLTAAGPVDRPAIVFLHGTRLSRAVWTPQLAALGDEFRVLAVDLPGHGDRATEPFTLDGAVDVVAATIRNEAAEARAVVVGLSLGGYVAMALAARHPELVRALVIAGASAEPAGVRSIAYRALAAAMDRIDGRRLDELSASFFRARYPGPVGDAIVAGGFWSANGAEALRALVGERFLPRLAGYPGPTLILNGEFDLFFRLSAGTFAAVARSPRRVLLRGALHLSNLDRPEAFNRAVRVAARSVAPAVTEG